MKHSLPRVPAAPFLLLPVFLVGGAVPASAMVGSNLVVNGSFETAGNPSLDGWQPDNSSLISTVSPGSPGGGDWALQVEADQAPTSGFVTQKVEGLADGDVVKLQADVRAVGASGGGRILLVVGESPQAMPSKWAETTSESWATLSVVDTLELAETDSVWVKLSSLNTEVVPRVGLFDSVTLTVLDSVPVAPVTWGALKVRYR